MKKIINAYLAVAYLTMLLNTPRTFASKVVLGTSSFNETDVTAIIQNQLSGTVDTIIIQNTGKPWIVKPLIAKRDNITLILEPGVVLQAKSGAFADRKARLLSFEDGASHRIKNINIIGYGATFQMVKSEYTTEEYRHCLGLSWVENVKVYGITFKDSGGDGIFVDRNYYGDPSLNVHIKDCVCDNNRRQGISVISVEDMLIENCVFKNTTGTPPSAGIDIEPDAIASIPNQVIKKLLVRNCRFENNEGSGIEVALHQLNNTSEPVSIKFQNCYVTGEKGISIFTGDGLKGIVEFENCFIENINEEGLNHHAPAYSGTSSLSNPNPNKAFAYFKNCVWKNVGKLDSPFKFEGTKWNDPNFRIAQYGGIEFRDCVIDDTQNKNFFTAIDGANSSGLANVKGNITVINPNGAKTNFGSIPKDVSLSITERKTFSPSTIQTSILEVNGFENPIKPTIIRIDRSNNNIQLPYPVLYNLSGKATSIADYSIKEGFIMILPNENSATDMITPLPDLINEGPENLVYTFLPLSTNSTGANWYTLSGNTKPELFINDKENLTPNTIESEKDKVAITIYKLNDILIIDNLQSEEQLIIYDLYGRIIMNHYCQSKQIDMSSSSISSGVYLVKQSNRTKKLIVP